MVVPLFSPRGVRVRDAPRISSRLYASDALCPRAPVGHARGGFVVAVAAWTLGEDEGAGGVVAGNGGAVSTWTTRGTRCWVERVKFSISRAPVVDVDVP